MDPLSLGIGGLAVATLGGAVALLIKALAAKKDGQNQTTTVFQGATDTGGHQMSWVAALDARLGRLEERLSGLEGKVATLDGSLQAALRRFDDSIDHLDRVIRKGKGV